MDLALSEKLLWAYGFLQNLALLFVLLKRGRARSFPAFTVLIAFGTLRTIVLFIVFRAAGRHHAYALAYWYAAGLDLLLQVAVVYELARSALYRSSEWIPGAKSRFLLFAIAAPAVGILFAATMTPAARNALDSWDARANLFITVTICLLVSAVMTVSRQFGGGWNDLVLRFSAGLAVWSLASFATGTLHAYWRTADSFSLLENVAGIVYLLVTLYWIVVFWCSTSERFTANGENADISQRRLARVAERLRSSSSEQR